MSTKISNSLVEISPALTSNYASGDVLFDLEELTLLTYRPGQSSILRQLGVFWDIDAAPNITLYFFSEKPAPASYGAKGTTPAFSFGDRAKLIGALPISDAANTPSYTTLHSKSYLLATGMLAVFSSADKIGWMGATIDEAHTGDLAGKLKITLNIEKL